jgi:hypothetical protein
MHFDFAEGCRFALHGLEPTSDKGLSSLAHPMLAEDDLAIKPSDSAPRAPNGVTTDATTLQPNLVPPKFSALPKAVAGACERAGNTKK